MSNTVKAFSQINKSPTKQQYSFPKEKRFKPAQELYCHKIYNAREVKDKRSATIGSGQRTKLIHTANPSPNQYQLKSKFDLIREGKLKDGVTMGLGREQIKFGDVVHYQKNTPGPQKYAMGSTLSNIGVTMQKRYDKLNKATFLQNPGPNHYKINSKDDHMGIHTLSNFRSTGFRIIPPIAKTITTELDRNPGPGKYNKVSIKVGENSFNSRYKNQRSISFGNEKRQFLRIPKHQPPGPGYYTIQGEF